jgi:hypothetical protein
MALSGVALALVFQHVLQILEAGFPLSLSHTLYKRISYAEDFAYICFTVNGNLRLVLARSLKDVA